MLQAVYTTYHTASANHKTLQIAAWIQMRLVMVTTPPKLCPKSKAITTISLTTSPMSSETSINSPVQPMRDCLGACVLPHAKVRPVIVEVSGWC